MVHLGGAITLFILFVTTHVLCYRSGFFKPSPSILLMILGFWLVIYVIFFYFFRVVQPLWVSSLLLYLLLCVAYIMEYTLIELESPSMRIVRHVRSKAEGIATKEELRDLFTDEEMIISRLKDLTDHGFIQWDGLRYSLTPRGRLVARCFTFYRNLIRRGMGG